MPLTPYSQVRWGKRVIDGLERDVMDPLFCVPLAERSYEFTIPPCTR